MYVGIVLQVQCGGVSNSVTECPQNKASIQHHTGKNTRSGCGGTGKIRSLPGLSHVTYSWMPRNRRRSFLEISYSDDPANNQVDPQSRSTERLRNGPRKSCCAAKKSGTADKGRVTPEQCNKWPVHTSLTIVCDSRPCHTDVRLGTTGNVRRLEKNSMLRSRVIGPQSVPAVACVLNKETETGELYNDIP